MKQLSIIAPVYKVEKFICQCLESIFRQGMNDEEFEVILVNDGTPDKSIEVISDIIEAHQNIQIINQENQGVAMARNNGLERATGEYILFVDSDDMLVDRALPFLLGKAFEANADLIVADYLEKKRDFNNIPVFTNNAIQIDEKSGEELYIEDLRPEDCHVWHTLYKREFLQQNNITFIPGIYYEDIPYTHECVIKAKRCLRIHTPMYIYRKDNTYSITSYFDKRSGLDFGTAIGKTWGLTHINNLSPKIAAKLKQNLFVSFSTLMCLVVHDIPIYSDRIEILKNIKHAAPDMYFRNGTKQLFVSFMFRYMPSVYMALRSFYAGTIEKSVWELRRHFKHILHK